MPGPANLVRRFVILSDAQRLSAALRRQGIGPLLDPAEMHVTQMVSQQLFDAEPMSEVIEVELVNAQIRHLGKYAALVLGFESEALGERFDELQLSGAVSIHDEPLWHVTLSYMLPGVDPADIDLSVLPESLRLGPEVHSEMDVDGWSPMQVNHLDEFKRTLRLAEDGKHVEFAQTIEGVEILRAGKWNGIKFTVDDLSYLAAVNDQLGYRPVVKLGHESDGGDPAMGYVTKLRVAGDRLLADFENVPDDLVAMINDGRFHSVSSEVFFNLTRNGRSYRMALKAVAVLGASVPAVDGLKPLGEALAGLAASDTVSLHQYEGEPMTENETGKGKGKGSEAEPDRAAELAEAQARIAELQQQLEAKQADDSAVEINRLQERVKAAEAALAETAEANRMESVVRLAASCRVPALRPHLHAMADLATRNKGTQRLVKFSAESDEKARDADAMVVLQDFISRLNTLGEVLLGERAASGDFERDEDAPSDNPDEQLTRLIADYERKHQVSFSEARRAVMSDRANAKVVRAYNSMAV